MPTVGDPAPDFSGYDFINDQTVSLSDYLGKVIVLSFVAHGCGHCQNELPCLKSLWSTYASQGAQLLAVSEGWWGGTQAAADSWLTGEGVTFPAVFDADPFAIGTPYGINGVPRIFVIDTAMTIQYDFVGETECSVIEAAVQSLLPSKFPKFVNSFKLANKYVPRLLQVAYLIMTVKTEHVFKGIDVRPSKRFVEVVGRYLNAYLSKGTMPPADVAAPILNMADDYLAGNVVKLRAGDFIALNNHVRALAKARTERS